MDPASSDTSQTDLSRRTIGQWLKDLTPGQLWKIVAALVALVTVSFLFGHWLGQQTCPKTPVAATPPPTGAGPPSIVTDARSPGVAKAPPGAMKPRLVIYADELAGGWGNWSWDCRCLLRTQEHVLVGNFAIRADLKGHGGLAFGNNAGVHTQGFDFLDFSLHGGSAGGQVLKVFVNDKVGNGARNPVILPPLEADRWKSYSIPLADLDAISIRIFKINISEAQGANAPPVYVDNVLLR